MMSQHIRVIAICVFSRADRILVTEAHDPVKNRNFCRPLGGGVNFGETGAEAVIREIREEVGAEVANLRLLGTLENIFTYLGNRGHEIVRVYDGEFVPQSMYELDPVPVAESDGAPFQARWRTLDYFSPERPLVPDGLLQLLRGSS